MAASPPSPQRPVVLAAASGGGHWRQLRRLSAAFEDCDRVWATVFDEEAPDTEGDPVHRLPEVSRWTVGRMPWHFVRAWSLIGRVRPDVVVSTGALPGLLVLVAARLRGVSTVWIDSLANVERMSMSGRLARRFAGLWLTQWAHLARDGGPRYHGTVVG
jgi:UDP-N-acetylglucosamine:LPS N-acetylglucosamine transferase